MVRVTDCGDAASAGGDCSDGDGTIAVITMEPNQQYAYFTVTGDFDPAALSSQLGLLPTECWRRGDVNPRTQKERRFSRWSLHSRLDRQSSLEAHIGDVLEQLDTRCEAVTTIASQYGATMQLVAYFHTDYPGIHFGASVVRRMSQYDLSVDFDFYWLYSD